MLLKICGGGLGFNRCTHWDWSNVFLACRSVGFNVMGFFLLFKLADPCTDKLVTGEETDASCIITHTTRLVWVSGLSEPLQALQSPAWAAQLKTTAEMPPASWLMTHVMRKREKDDLNLKSVCTLPSARPTSFRWQISRKFISQTILCISFHWTSQFVWPHSHREKLLGHKF